MTPTMILIPLIPAVIVYIARCVIGRPSPARCNAAIVAAIVATTILATPAIDAHHDTRFEPKVTLTALHVHQLRALIDTWEAV